MSPSMLPEIIERAKAHAMPGREAVCQNEMAWASPTPLTSSLSPLIAAAYVHRGGPLLDERPTVGLVR